MSPEKTKRRLGVEFTCQKCKKGALSTRRRSIYTKDYVGPCADSFCYASCDSRACKPVDLTVCDDCAKALS